MDGVIVDAQLRVLPPFLQHPCSALMTPSSLKAQEGVGSLDCFPFSSGLQCTQVGPGITPCLLLCPVPCSLFVCLEVCVCCGCVRCLCLFMSISRLCLPTSIYVSSICRCGSMAPWFVCLNVCLWVLSVDQDVFTGWKSVLI